MPRKRAFDADEVLRTDEAEDPSKAVKDAYEDPPSSYTDPNKDATKRTRATEVLRTDESEDPSKAIRDSYQDS